MMHSFFLSNQATTQHIKKDVFFSSLLPAPFFFSSLIIILLLFSSIILLFYYYFIIIIFQFQMSLTCADPADDTFHCVMKTIDAGARLRVTSAGSIAISITIFVVEASRYPSRITDVGTITYRCDGWYRRRENLVLGRRPTPR